MSDDITGQSVLFPDLFSKPLRAQFDERHGSSDGGAILLKACDAALALSARLTAALIDRRQPGKVEHSVRDLLRQRLFGIACGYADANDAARLGDDPIQKLLLERDALTGAMLASQPTLSRFENAATRADLYRMGVALAESLIERHRRRLGRRCKHITIDLDPTDDPTHGGQQLTFFNGHYDTWCYLPVAAFLTFNHEPDQYLFTYVLRPGNAPATRGAIGILQRVLERLREAFPPVSRAVVELRSTVGDLRRCPCHAGSAARVESVRAGASQDAPCRCPLPQTTPVLPVRLAEWRTGERPSGPRAMRRGRCCLANAPGEPRLASQRGL